MSKSYINTQGLTKNPLGIIALFISLIYSFACLVLGLSGNSLIHQEKLPLIWFLIGFPILILISFLYLVIKHHQKLYGPGDFKNEENFFNTIKAKVKYLLIEDLVFELIYSEFGIKPLRHVAFDTFYFDGVIELEEEVMAFEVEYLKNEPFKKKIASQREFKNIDMAKEYFSPKSLKVFWIIVYEGKKNDSPIKEIQKIVNESKRQIEYRLYDINELVRKNIASGDTAFPFNI